MKRLVLIHGRSQENKNPDELKNEWLDALQSQLAAQGLSLPRTEDIYFPYFGDSLFKLCNPDGEETTTPEVLLRGTATNGGERLLFEEMVRVAALQYGISEVDAIAAAGVSENERGPQNTAAALGFARLLSKIPGVDTATLAQITRDVYMYLTNPGIATFINSGVRSAFSPRVDTVVVSHSLGTLLSHRVLNSLDSSHRVSHLITLGSPLGIPSIQNLLAPLKRPSCVAQWSNARDPKDVVALYPLTKPAFPLSDIADESGIENPTSNHHGIAGYIGHPKVSRWIYEALRLGMSPLDPLTQA